MHPNLQPDPHRPGPAPRHRWAVAALSLGAAGALLLGTAGVAGATGRAGAATHQPRINVPAPPTTPVTLTETGSSLLYPLWNLWGPGYQAKYPTVSLSTASTGSGTGISSALAGTSDIGASDAYLSPTELSHDRQARNIPLAISAQFIGYNVPGVTKTLNLDPQVLAGIYKGQITHWNDRAIAALNPGVHLPATPIVTLHRADPSGDTFLFTSYLTKGDPSGWGNTLSYGTTVAWPTISGALGETGNSGMLQGCQTTPGCIAYIGISYLKKAKAAGIGEAALANRAHKYLLPTAATISAAAAAFASRTPANGVVSMIDGPAAGGYPIINYEYAIVVDNPPSATTAQAERSLLDWAISPTGGNAASYLDQVGFEPLPGAVAEQSAAQINRIR